MGPEGLQVHRDGLLEVAAPMLLLLEPAVAAAEAAGSTAGWAGGSTAALAPPGGSELAHWPLALLASASCGWGTQSCGGKSKDTHRILILDLCIYTSIFD